ncbi:phage tail tape measure protein [Vallitalea guaymasensis]|uniref:phage tail tape measure protein n=1 Tax=Vallitalea guaymasensis TaxID=1185412 RepID=UPI000DE21AB2|nr:phage tail tape measure protein [Vallitalea guaymasensis]
MATKNEIEVLIKAYNKFSDTFQKFRSEFDKTQQAEKKFSDTTDKANNQVNELLDVMGNVAVLRGFQKAVGDIINTGKDLELTFKQVNAVSGDYSDTIKNMAMKDTDSFYAPSKMAEGYYELASAGIETKDMIEAINPALDFAASTTINATTAINAGIATVKAFNLDFAQSETVFDAFTEAVSSSSLKGNDFIKIMQNAGSVSKLANQDFRQLVAIMEAMKNAGVDAGDGATSVKSALLALINPSKEAKGIMKELGIEVYDSSGNMKQWSDIVETFEQGLMGLTEESKNMVLATVFGSDGIRAIATSLNAGSDALKLYVENMKEADGKTEETASFMQDTFSGALDKVNGNLERLKAGVYDDLEPALKTMIGLLNDSITWFLELDDGVRTTIEFLVGTAGLVVAITSVISVIKKLVTAMGLISSVSSPIGLAVTAISAVVSGVVLFSSSLSNAKVNSDEFTQSVRNKIDALDGEVSKTDELISKYETLNNKTDKTKEEKEQLRDIEKELAKLYPESADGIDKQNEKYTTQIDLIKDLNEEKKKQLNGELDLLIAKGKLNVHNLQDEIKGIQDTTKSIREKRDSYAEFYQDNIDLYNELITLRDKALETGDFEEFEKKLNNAIKTIRDNYGKDFSGTQLTGIAFEIQDAYEEWAKLNDKLVGSDEEIAEKRADIENYGNAIIQRAIANNQALDNSKTINKLHGYIKELQDGVITLEQLQKRIDFLNNHVMPYEYYGKSTDTGEKEEPEKKPKKIIGSSSGGSKKTAIERYIDTLNKYEKNLTRSLNKINREIDLFNTKEEYFKKVFEDTGSLEAYNGYLQVTVSKVEALRQKQEALKSTNDSLRNKRDELNSKIDGSIKKYGATSDEVESLKSKLDNLEKTIASNSTEWFNMQNEITSTNEAMNNLQIDTYIEKLNQLTSSLSESTILVDSKLQFLTSKASYFKSNLDLDPKNHTVYFDTLVKKIEEYKNKQDTLHTTNTSLRNERTSLNKQIEDASKKYGKESTQVKKLRSELDKLESTINDNSGEWWDIQEAIKETSKSMEEARESIKKGIGDTESKLLDSFSQTAKDQMDKQFSVIDNRISAYQKQIQDLDRQYAKEDFEKDESQRNEKLAQLNKEYQKLLLNDSQWGAKQRNLIVEEIAKIEAEQQEALTEYKRNEEKQRLEDEITSLENEKKEIQNHYETLLANIQNIFVEKTASIPTLLQQYEDSYKKAGEKLGDSFVEGINEKLKSAREAFSELNNLGGNNDKESVGNGVGSSNVDKSKHYNAPLVNIDKLITTKDGNEEVAVLKDVLHGETYGIQDK